MSREDTLTALNTLAEHLYAPPPLVLADRCDRCENGCSQAFIRAYKVVDGKNMDILLCAHHGNKHQPELIANGWQIQDESHKINAKPMSGAPESAFTVNEH